MSAMRNLPQILGPDFEVYEDFACFHPSGVVSLEEGVKLIKDALLLSGKKGVRRLLVDATQLRGFAAPALAERSWISRDLAAAANPGLVVAFAFQGYLLDPERFGVTVARNAGMRTDAFNSTADALKWLLQQSTSP
jgi:hypothetical protein